MGEKLNGGPEIDPATLVALRAEAQAALLSPDAATMHRGGLILAFLDDRDALSSALAQAEKDLREVDAALNEARRSTGARCSRRLP